MRAQNSLCGHGAGNVSKQAGSLNLSTFIPRTLRRCSANYFLRPRRPGFTLVELLVVIAIIGILASMILSGLARAKERSRETQCIHNLREIGIVARMYREENRDFLTRLSGGCDPLPGCLMTNYGPATNRTLYSYVKNSEIFRCPRDKGKISEDCHLHPETTLLPSCWETRGFSYEMNVGLPVGLPMEPTLRTNAGNVIGHPDSWVPDPARFIQFYEPPATPQVCHASPPLFEPRWYQWHRGLYRVDFLDPRLAPPRFFSPIGFVDGHAQFLNFTKALTTDPYYPFEENKDWMWYKPLPPPKDPVVEKTL
jgi:prepilin-type N-terminal cleavage/methylation domain-containing protein